MAETRGSARDWSANRRQFLLTGGSLALGSVLGCRTTSSEPADDIAIEIEGPPKSKPVVAEPPPAPVEPIAPPSFTMPAAPTPDARPGGLWAAPDLSAERLLRNIAGIRPYRRGSVRIESARLHRRLLIHNYGHGGAGITLSPGSAFEVLELLAASEPDAQEVAVLGSGVNGLTVATELVKRGFRVQVYAEQFPPNTTSNIAGGQFAPSLVAHGRNDEERDLFTRRVHGSFEHYAKLVGLGFGVFPRLNYTTSSSGSALRQVPRADDTPIPSFDPLPIEGVQSQGYAYPTLLIEPPIYLARLHADLVARGVVFHTRRFEALDELRELTADVVINCLGLGAGELFKDSRVVPIRGQLVLMEPQDLPYLLSNSGYLFPRTDCIVLSGTVERGVRDAVPNQRRCERILAQHRRFFARS
jgi:D-amino-acid oxidase